MGKLHSMHLTVPGAVAHIYRVQRALDQGGVDQAWLFLAFHREIADLHALAVQTTTWPTHLDDIVHREPTHMGFLDALGLGSWGVWLDLSRSGRSLM